MHISNPPTQEEINFILDQMNKAIEALAKDTSKCALEFAWKIRGGTTETFIEHLKETNSPLLEFYGLKRRKWWNIWQPLKNLCKHY